MQSIAGLRKKFQALCLNIDLESFARYDARMLRVVFPGTFDPPTNGHLNIIQRCAAIYDEIEVVIAKNRRKDATFTPEERLKLMQEMVSAFPNVRVHVWDRLIVEFAEKIGARLMVRGVRALSDFEYEFELSLINRGLDSRIETVLLPTDPKYFVLRSSAIKELARLDGDISGMVPANVAMALRSRLSESV